MAPTRIHVRRYLQASPALMLRWGLGLVFLWSGLSKVIDLPGAIGVCTNRAEAIDFVSTLYWVPFDPEVFVRLQSVAEITLGLLLVMGLWLELAAAASAILFLLFFGLFNFNVVWKNLGLLGASLALFALPPDRFTLDHYLRRRAPKPRE
jgi:uncharacterized membrane protein YphA (DoxX/SURF4 family)